MSHWCLVGRPFPQDTRKTQLSPSCPNSSHSSMCKSHGSLHGMLSCEIPTKTLQSSIGWDFTHSLSIAQPLQSNPTINTGYKRLNKITIKFGTELKPTKHLVVNHNFIADNSGEMAIYAFLLGFSSLSHHKEWYEC